MWLLAVYCFSSSCNQFLWNFRILFCWCIFWNYVQAFWFSTNCWSSHDLTRYSVTHQVSFLRIRSVLRQVRRFCFRLLFSQIDLLRLGNYRRHTYALTVLHSVALLQSRTWIMFWSKGNLSSLNTIKQLLHPSKNIDVDQFLDSHSAYNKYAVDRKEFNSTTLAYVTPVFFEFTSFILVLQWNKLGYEVAETFTHKFNLLAPVWFQVLGKKKSYTVTGVPNIDKGKFVL